MTSPINGIVSNVYDDKTARSTSTYSNGTTVNAGKSKSVADQDTFMKLLVAQLKYQDPSNPADSTQFLAQTAQFTQVEKLGQIAQMMQAQQLIGASSLVGQTVTYQDADGVTQTGVVTKTKLNGDSEPTLVVGNMDVQLSKVTEVQQAGTAPAAPAQPAATATAPAATPAVPAAPAPAATPAAPAATPSPAADGTSDDSATTKEI
ncbi:flagellar hook assembly protein FlgD [Actinoplanes sp. TFC3]|uniref:flagellar hook assembly protein FlgD n=1 Tax=Actinoplanes sp. TFC3 TaxID=1710355 RepID=UPI00082DB0E3|nr:flagellar hook capping FlgD N-terminal domain-containing protein [Actinoplanes sp. TFC3]